MGPDGQGVLVRLDRLLQPLPVRPPDLALGGLGLRLQDQGHPEEGLGLGPLLGVVLLRPDLQGRLEGGYRPIEVALPEIPLCELGEGHPGASQAGLGLGAVLGMRLCRPEL